MRARSVQVDVCDLYERFGAPVVAGLDCGEKCVPFNPSGKPFCCDICHAVPAVHRQEWAYLRQHTALWHPWRGDECELSPEERRALRAQTPAHMLLLACEGPAHCQRAYRALSCRQFPFFPYISSDLRFLGLAYAWDFEPVCWVISHLECVSARYRQEFVRLYDDLLAQWPAELKSYALYSDEMRAVFAVQRRRIPLLHRDGGYCLLSPVNERLYRLAADRLPKFGVYRDAFLTIP
ncbi:MAG: hypothetical protein ACOYYS_25280 [Chloroflexota bacterium]